MAYDTNVTSSTIHLEIKRKVSRIDIQRPGGTKKSLYANCYLTEDTIDATPGSPTSESIINSATWLVSLEKEQVLDIQGVNNFMNGVIALSSYMKSEFDANGSNATGSIQRL
jgi:hypothetical protein